MKQPGFYGYCTAIEELLDSACNELSPEVFEYFKKAVKVMVDCYD